MRQTDIDLTNVNGRPASSQQVGCAMT